MMNEEWRAIAGTHGEYWVSSLGRVMSKKHGSTRILKPARISKGYLAVDLSMCNIRTKGLIHRLVAEAFIPNPDNLPEVNHIDEDKANNCVYNLEWCTRGYNHAYGTARERNAAPRRKSVLQIDPLTSEIVAEYPSGTMAEVRVGHGVFMCLAGHSKTSHGYIWRYKDGE